MSIGSMMFTRFRRLNTYVAGLWKLGPQNSTYYKLINNSVLGSTNGVTNDRGAYGSSITEAYLYAGTDGYFLISDASGNRSYAPLSLSGQSYVTNEADYQNQKSLATNIRL